MFITLEGPEGAGKSTVIHYLKSKLEESGREVVLTREPGNGEFGKSIRKLLLEGDDLSSQAELFLFLADRAENARQTVLPALNAGKVVLCDRHADSTVVYQGYARGLDIPTLRELNLLATQNLRPDLILLLDLPVEVGLNRITDKDRLDREPLEFHTKVRHGFLEEAKREPARWHTINAEQSPENVSEDCWQAVKSRL